MNAQPIYSLFKTAISHSLKYPKIRLLATDGTVVVLRMNGGKSRYPGTIAVTDDRPFGSNSYFGRIETNGTLTAGRDCTSAVIALLETLATNPAETAANYGKLTGNCCFCEAPLKDARSTSVGYGPICADHFGLPWGTESNPFDAVEFADNSQPEALLNDPTTPFWAKDVIRVALTKDSVDAANVFEVLAKSFNVRAHAMAR